MENTVNLLSVASTILNTINCSTSLNCTNYNRQSCQHTSGICGACLPGYIGEAGDHNTICIPTIWAYTPRYCTQRNTTLCTL